MYIQIYGGRAVEVQFAKWGNSLAVRVPSKIAKAFGIEAGSLADLDLQDDKLVISLRSPAYQLQKLVADISDDNLHGEVNTGCAIGAEVVD